MSRAALVLLSLLAVGSAGCSVPAAVPAAPLSPAPATLFDAPWSFDDEAHLPVSFATWRGKPVVVTMFYRGCSVRCPMTVAKLRAIEAAMTARGAAADFVLVTLDPHNDTPEKLAAFKKEQGLPGSWHLLSGSDADTRALVRYLDVHAAYDIGHIDHDVKIVLFDRSGARVRSYRGWAFDEKEAAASL